MQTSVGQFIDKWTDKLSADVQDTVTEIGGDKCRDLTLKKLVQLKYER